MRIDAEDRLKELLELYNKALDAALDAQAAGDAVAEENATEQIDRCNKVFCGFYDACFGNWENEKI